MFTQTEVTNQLERCYKDLHEERPLVFGEHVTESINLSRTILVTGIEHSRWIHFGSFVFTKGQKTELTGKF